MRVENPVIYLAMEDSSPKSSESEVKYLARRGPIIKSIKYNFELQLKFPKVIICEYKLSE